MSLTVTTCRESVAAQLELGFRRPTAGRSRFGDMAVLAFLLVQGLDGVFTYLGVSFWGPSIEANPIVSASIDAFGLGAGLATAKLLAVAFGIALHLRCVHRAVAILTVLYIAAAILPWAALFLMS